MTIAETTALSDLDVTGVCARSVVDFDAVSSNVAAAAGTMTAVYTSDVADGGGDLLSWTYAVRASATEGLASGQKRVEVFDIRVDSGHGRTMTGIVTFAIIGGRNTATETVISDVGGIKKTVGKYLASELFKGSRSVRSPGKDGIATDVASIVNVRTASVGVTASGEPCEATGNGGSMTRSTQGINDESRFNFIVALVTCFYIIATVIAVFSMAGGSRDAIGYLASLFVFGSFGCKTMVPLRLLALMSNVAFMTYAVRNQLAPVLVLHALLLPINVVRLWQIKEKRRQASCRPQLSQT